VNILIIIIVAALIFWYSYRFGVWCILQSLMFMPGSTGTINKVVKPVLLEFLQWIVLNEKCESSNLDKTVQEYIAKKVMEHKAD